MLHFNQKNIKARFMQLDSLRRQKVASKKQRTMQTKEPQLVLIGIRRKGQKGFTLVKTQLSRPK
ncbi:MAG: hypothetical protein A2527_03140 [Candidatus Lambdaproteobacteria bacterium RIFOXYD2_FULL_50_16]|uniref:Uncharacterized protein n=1 Tax=Candidatus Lambdaproteobacteria bacterium RIFOXYD2_FULL_50_16 TaxID=1817772 RepID=A0A1F6GER0_9PROT|nr:MAG: hypothetical protein A2527_03140 [Candidatus Lambdaproteobacteria bacterium RIFOXYD2_FULL_50_16]